jgi:hypothetical protein
MRQMKEWSQSPAATVLRVGGQLLLDRLTRPKATGRDDVPTSIDAITPAWWTDVLCADVPGAEVTAHSLVSASKGTHQRHRFALSYNDAGHAAGLPTAVFTKTLPTLVTRMMGGYNGTSRAEGRFFMRIRPDMEIETPTGYHAAFDRTTLAGINVLEDIVATKNATFCDFGTEVTRSMAEDMVDLLAILHGHRYDDPRLDTELRWVANFADWFRIGTQKMSTERYTQDALDRAAPVIPDDVMARRHEVWPATVAAAVIHKAGPRSLLHSDVHIGNWYITGDGRMGLCDWQCLTQGHWSRDLSYMISAALTIEHRRAWEHDLLQRYVDRLNELTGAAIDFDQAWNQYRAQMLHALWMWTITLCHSPFLPAMQSEATSVEMIARIAAAMSDLDSIGAALSDG